MKKRALLVAALGLCLSFSVGVFAACGEGDKECDGHVDANADGKCDVCGEGMPAQPEEEYAITDGVFNWVYQQGKEQFLKFYEDGTFYGENMDGTTRTGRYKLVEAGDTITYTDAGADFIVNRLDEELASPTFKDVEKTANSYVEFFEDDGTTPLSMMVDEPTDAIPRGYPDDAPSNRIAYVDNKLHNVDMKANVISVRTLSHSPTLSFTKEDEKPIEQFRLMLSDEGDIPAGSTAGETVQDHYISITQSGFTSYITGREVLGSYTLEGDVYTLTDVFAEEAFGTLTLQKSEGGAIVSATFASADGGEIGLVSFAEASFGTLKGDFTGMGFPIPFTMTLNQDGTLVLNAATNAIEGTWSYDGEKLSYTAEGVEFTEMSYNAETGEASVTVAGTLNGTQFTVPMQGVLKGELPVSIQEVMRASGSTNIGAPAIVELVLYDNNTYTVSITLDFGAVQQPMGVKDSGTYTIAQGGYTFESKNGFELTLSVDGVQITATWKGSMAGSSGPQPVDVTLSGVYSYTFAGSLWGSINLEMVIGEDGAYTVVANGKAQVDSGSVVASGFGDTLSLVFTSEENCTVTYDAETGVVTWVGAIPGLGGGAPQTIELTVA